LYERTELASLGLTAVRTEARRTWRSLGPLLACGVVLMNEATVLLRSLGTYIKHEDFH
jgi:hypothetical protein